MFGSKNWQKTPKSAIFGPISIHYFQKIGKFASFWAFLWYEKDGYSFLFLRI
jgi:hypothetical protein